MGYGKIPEKRDSFGLNLIDALTEQLNGNYEIEIFQMEQNIHFHFENINS
jgi:two-component sensor histidine kinase